MSKQGWRVALVATAVAIALIFIGQSLVRAEEAPAPPQRQMVCYPTPLALKAFDDAFGQKPEVAATLSAGSAFLVVVNPDDHTWTAFVSPDPAYLCPVLKGSDWTPAKPDGTPS